MKIAKSKIPGSNVFELIFIPNANKALSPDA